MSEAFKAANQSTRVSAYLPHLDETGRAQLNVDLAPYLLGPVSGQINLVSGVRAPPPWTFFEPEPGGAEFEGDWLEKSLRPPGELSGQVLLRNDRPVSMTDFHLNAEDLLVRGQIEFDGEGDPSRLQFLRCLRRKPIATALNQPAYLRGKRDRDRRRAVGPRGLSRR